MILVLSFLCSLFAIPHAIEPMALTTSVRMEEDAVLQYQQFIREDAKEHRLFLENSFDKLLLLISGGTFLFGSLLTWMNYRTKSEIKSAVNKRFDDQIDILLKMKINELQQEMEFQSRELGLRITTADKVIRELSGRLSQTSSQGDEDKENNQETQHIQYAENVIKQILWVDDNPANNKNIIGMFPKNEVVFDLAKSTAEARTKLAKEKYALIISDMKRDESPDEGIQLLRLRNEKYSDIPFAIFSSSKSLAGYA